MWKMMSDQPPPESHPQEHVLFRNGADGVHIWKGPAGKLAVKCFVEIELGTINYKFKMRVKSGSVIPMTEMSELLVRVK